MRKNKLKEKLLNGNRVIGCDLTFSSPFVTELIAEVGFDFMIINCEYSPVSDDQAEHMIRAAFARDLIPLAAVRHEADYYGCRRLLDRGAMGIVMPSVRSPADAQRFVEACKFVPDGNRDQCGWIQTNDFGLHRTPKEYSQFANQETLCIALCENKESIDCIDQIAAVPGIDIVWIGAGNLSAELGWPGQETMDKIVSEMATKISNQGKIVGAATRYGNIDQLDKDNINFAVTIAHDQLKQAFLKYLEPFKTKDPSNNG